MAPLRKSGVVKGAGPKGKNPASSSWSSSEPPKPYRRIPESLEPFVEALDTDHVYIAHVDSQPAAFKRRMFLVPVAMNVIVVVLFAWRVRRMLPFYLDLLGSALGERTGTSVTPSEHTWARLVWIVGSRAFSLMLDLVLIVFVWPWPVEFCLGRTHGSPVAWRWAVGFRDQEVYVRRSREWDRPLLAGPDAHVLKSPESRALLLRQVRPATDPDVLRSKTGYLTMNGEWDLDWAAMVHAHRLVDKKDLAIDAFSLVVLVHGGEEHGWMVMETKKPGGEVGAVEEERRRQVFAFRDALTALGHEDLFYRWIEIVQFETTQPGGFTPDKQEAVAKQIRGEFQAKAIDFDQLWKDTVGTDSMAGMA